MNHVPAKIAGCDIGEKLRRLLVAAPPEGLHPHLTDALPERLRHCPLENVIDAAEQHGSANPRATAQLYQAWITAHPASPQLFAAWFNLGVTCNKAGNQPGAMNAYRQSLAIRADFSPAAVNLGLALEAAGNKAAALDTWRLALQPDDARVSLLNHRARLLETTGELNAAEQFLRSSLLTTPEQPDVIQHFVHLRQKLCRWPVLIGDIPGLKPADLLRHAGPLSIQALTDDIAVQRAVGAEYINRKTVAVATNLSDGPVYGHTRLRIGYLSSDFCRHALAYLITELFEQHDRSRFEIFGYGIGRDDGSDIRRRMIAAFDHFADLTTLDDEAAARKIRADEIDVLIDLNGLTAGARLQILRWRPAPLQATYLGFVGPVPLPELDVLLCDDHVIPPALADAYHPNPLAIGPLYQVNDSKREIGAAVARTDVGLPVDRFVFCSFTNHYKITESMFASWMNILRRTERSVLWLAADTAASCQAMAAHAAAHGINADRLLFAPRVGPADYMARLALGDLFLDTFPYNAGTVASDAMRMELPVVTRSGQAFASRMAGRLLTAIDAGEGIAETPAEYEDIAVNLATDPIRYVAYKAKFTLRAWQEGLGDIRSFTKNFEQAIENKVGLCPNPPKA